jgi:outer membrane protein assembly factor BamB
VVPRAPFLERQWAQPTVREEQTRNWLDKQVLPYLEQRGEPVLPATSPLAVKDKVLFRSNWGVHAVNLQTGKLEWESDSRWSVDRMLRDPGKTGAVTFWLNAYLGANRPAAVFENSLVGSLSTDGKRLFAVEDFQVAPFRAPNGNGQPDLSTGYGPGLTDALLHSRLQAFDLVTGKLIWELGARRDASADGGDGGAAEADDLAGSFFLSAPLVLDGKVYVLNEKDANLRLACLEPAHGGVLFLQHLATFRLPLNLDPPRRMRAAALAYGDGVLVCPTNVGFLLAIDLPTRTLLWSHDYRDPASIPQVPPENEQQLLRFQLRQARPQPPGHSWKFAPPLILHGKVVFTPPDAPSILCLDLRDGSTVWEAKAKQDDVYLAGVFPGADKKGLDGRVLIVGKKSCRAVNLKDGKPLWTLETGLPSGRGAADGMVYYLPLKTAARTGEPEVCAIDVEHGQVLAHTPSPKGEVPGHLLFHEGMVVSQTVMEVTAYPQVRLKLEQIDALLDKDPHDPRALLERGKLKLGEGDRTGAAADLRAALTNKPPATLRDKARAALFEALTQLLQRDFAGGEKYLDECAKLCDVEVPEGATPKERQERLAEQQSRRATYSFLLGRGREQQGKLVPAVRAYLDFLAAGGDEPITSPDEPAVRVSRAGWAGAHLAALLASAPPAERHGLEDELAGRWRALRTGGDLAAVRRFARVLGDTPAGREARWLLAERLQKENAFLETELVLLQLRQAAEPAEAARALEALAHLYTSRGLLDDAAFSYREVGREFARTVVRDGKTGRDLFDAVSGDKRLLPYLEEVNPTPPGQIKVEAGLGNFGQPVSLFAFEPEGEVLPFFHRHRLGLDLASGRLRVIDRTTQQEWWGQDLPRTSFPNLINANNPQFAFRPRYQAVGHLAIVNLGHLVFGLDLVERRVLWEKSLLGPLEALGISNVEPDPTDGKPLVVYQDGWAQKAGQVGVVGGAAVCLQTRGGLVALDPYTGSQLWSRTDVPMRTAFLADDRHLFVIEGENEGQPAGTRAFRAADGGSVAVADCSALYQRRLGVRGRHLLLGNDSGGGYVLHLVDVLSGKDVWEKKFPAGSRPLHSDDPSLTGVLDPDGKVSILDAASGRRLCAAAVDPRDFNRRAEVRLLQDRAQFYVACNDPVSPQVFRFGPPAANVLPGAGLRALPVNGKVYAFDRATGAENWEAKAAHQMLLVDQFAELPVLFFSSRYQRAGPNGQPVQTQSVGVRIISKRTGKLLYDEPTLNNTQPFHALTRAEEAGKVELVASNFRIALSLER